MNRYLRKSLPLALFLVFGITAVPAQNQAIIAGWNIFGVDPIPDRRIKNIADSIKRMNADLIVLTEVNGDDVPGKIVAETR